jgi:hypothetical protein
MLTALSILAIAIASRSHPRESGGRVNTVAGVNRDDSVPEPVMSTLRRACFDCHSDETRWPWYSTLPPASWLLERDVREGRGQLNFSRWMQYNRFDRADLLDKVCEKTTNRDMPLWQYRILHREARLTDVDIANLCDWSRLEAERLIGEGS